MTDDHDLIIRLDEKVEAAEKAIEALKGESATEKSVVELKEEVRGIKKAWWGIGILVINAALGWMSKGNL